MEQQTKNYTPSPIGYGRNVTGGGNGSIVLVDTLAALNSALRASGSSRIIITRNITFGVGDVIQTGVVNKTILGLPGVRLITTARVKDGGILQLNNQSSNVIIRNLIFEGPGAYDVDGRDLLHNNGGNGLWVDHCEFYDGVDGNFDNTNDNSDNITISWCKFAYNIPPLAGGPGGSDDHRFSNLVGASEDNAPSDGHFSITFQCCYWADGCRERMPRARNAELHILNCYYNTSVQGSVALGLEGGINGTNCYVEGTHFKQITNVFKDYGGTINLTFVDTIGSVADIGSAPRPSYDYTAMASGQVEAAVTAAAGATLNVGTDGSIS